MHVEYWWGSLGAFLKKRRRRRRSGRKLPLCLQDREEGTGENGGGWVRMGGGAFLPTLFINVTPCLYLLVRPCTCLQSHIDTYRWKSISTHTHTHVTLWCNAALSYPVIHCRYTSENRSVQTPLITCPPSPLHCPTLSCNESMHKPALFITASQFLWLSRLMRWKISSRHSRDAFRVNSMQSSFLVSYRQGHC